jgi:serine/threonine-protein kinase
MGEVRSHDTKLGRDVAIKILPRAFTRDPDRLARFTREARMLGALNHPNICTIYGLEEASGCSSCIELVEGVTLAELVSRQGTRTVFRRRMR